jgi:hypothetical protein
MLPRVKNARSLDAMLFAKVMEIPKLEQLNKWNASRPATRYTKSINSMIRAKVVVVHTFGENI